MYTPFKKFQVSVALVICWAGLVSGQENVDKLTQLKEGFEAAIERARSDANTARKALGVSHVTSLKKIEAALQKEGNLDTLLIVKSERESFENTGTLGTDKYPRLVQARASYVSSLARIDFKEGNDLFKLRDIYIRALKVLQVSLTKQGNVDRAIEAKKEIDLAEQLQKASQDVEFAGVQIDTASMQPFVEGARLYPNGIYIFNSVPTILEGLRYAQPNDKHQATMKFTVVSDGKLYLACTFREGGIFGNRTTVSDIKEDGWKQLPIKDLVGSNMDKIFLVLFERECKAGESFDYLTDKYCAPIIWTK